MSLLCYRYQSDTIPKQVDLEPASYVNYYKRATAYLSLGRHSAALDDFDHILRLNPGFVQVSPALLSDR